MMDDDCEMNESYFFEEIQRLLTPLNKNNFDEYFAKVIPKAHLKEFDRRDYNHAYVSRFVLEKAEGSKNFQFEKAKIKKKVPKKITEKLTAEVQVAPKIALPKLTELEKDFMKFVSMKDEFVENLYEKKKQNKIISNKNNISNSLMKNYEKINHIIQNSFSQKNEKVENVTKTNTKEIHKEKVFPNCKTARKSCAFSRNYSFDDSPEPVKEKIFTENPPKLKINELVKNYEKHEQKFFGSTKIAKNAIEKDHKEGEQINKESKEKKKTSSPLKSIIDSAILKEKINKKAAAHENEISKFRNSPQNKLKNLSEPNAEMKKTNHSNIVEVQRESDNEDDCSLVKKRPNKNQFPNIVIPNQNFVNQIPNFPNNQFLPQNFYRLPPNTNFNFPKNYPSNIGNQAPFNPEDRKRFYPQNIVHYPNMNSQNQRYPINNNPSYSNNVNFANNNRNPTVSKVNENPSFMKNKNAVHKNQNRIHKKVDKEEFYRKKFNLNHNGEISNNNPNFSKRNNFSPQKKLSNYVINYESGEEDAGVSFNDNNKIGWKSNKEKEISEEKKKVEDDSGMSIFQTLFQSKPALEKNSEPEFNLDTFLDNCGKKPKNGDRSSCNTVYYDERSVSKQEKFEDEIGNFLKNNFGPSKNNENTSKDFRLENLINDLREDQNRIIHNNFEKETRNSHNFSLQAFNNEDSPTNYTNVNKKNVKNSSTFHLLNEDFDRPNEISKSSGCDNICISNNFNISNLNINIGKDEISQCLCCQWMFPNSYTISEKNAHMDRCFEGNGQQDKDNYLSSHKEAQKLNTEKQKIGKDRDKLVDDNSLCFICEKYRNSDINRLQQHIFSCVEEKTFKEEMRFVGKKRFAEKQDK